MSDVTSIVVQLDKARQLLEISNNIYDCKVLFTIETENDTPFEFNVIDEDAIRKTYTMNKVDNGYVSGTAKNVLKPTYLAMSSNTPCKATVTLQQIKNTTTPVVIKPKTAAASTKPTSSQQPAASTSFYRKKSFLVIAAVAAVAIGYWYFKRSKKDSGVTIKTPGAVKIKSSATSVDPTSNDESSFGF